MKIWCWLKTIWYSLSRLNFFQDGIPIEGHNFIEEEEHKNVTVHILKCKDCGELSVNWNIEN